MKVTIALIQSAISEDHDKNLERAQNALKKASAKGAQVIVFSELFLSRYFCQSEDKRFFSLAEPIPGRTTELFQQLAKEHECVVILPLFERAGQDYYNSIAVIDADGSLLGTYRKRHIPDDLKNHYGEAFYFKKGDLGCPVFETKYLTIGCQICWDQWYPEPAREMAVKGAQLIVYPTAIGFQEELSESENEEEWNAWITIQRSHAIANNIFVAACNRIGEEGALNFWGSSFICGPMGKILKQATQDREEILITSIELDQIHQFRENWPFLENYYK